MSKKHLEHILPLFSLFIASLDFLFATFLLHRCFTCLQGKQLGDCSVAWHRPPKMLEIDRNWMDNRWKNRRTPRKTNMEPENTPLEFWKTIFQTIIFRVYVNLRGVYCSQKKWQLYLLMREYLWFKIATGRF